MAVDTVLSALVNNLGNKLSHDSS